MYNRLAQLINEIRKSSRYAELTKIVRQSTLAILGDEVAKEEVKRTLANDEELEAAYRDFILARLDKEEVSPQIYSYFKDSSVLGQLPFRDFSHEPLQVGVVKNIINLLWHLEKILSNLNKEVIKENEALLNYLSETILQKETTRIDTAITIFSLSPRFFRSLTSLSSILLEGVSTVETIINLIEFIDDNIFAFEADFSISNFKEKLHDNYLNIVNKTGQWSGYGLQLLQQGANITCIAEDSLDIENFPQKQNWLTWSVNLFIPGISDLCSLATHILEANEHCLLTGFEYTKNELVPECIVLSDSLEERMALTSGTLSDSWGKFVRATYINGAKLIISLAGYLSWISQNNLANNSALLFSENKSFFEHRLNRANERWVKLQREFLLLENTQRKSNDFFKLLERHSNERLSQLRPALKKILIKWYGILQPHFTMIDIKLNNAIIYALRTQEVQHSIAEYLFDRMDYLSGNRLKTFTDYSDRISIILKSRVAFKERIEKLKATNEFSQKLNTAIRKKLSSDNIQIPEKYTEEIERFKKEIASSHSENISLEQDKEGEERTNYAIRKPILTTTSNKIKEQFQHCLNVFNKDVKQYYDNNISKSSSAPFPNLNQSFFVLQQPRQVLRLMYLANSIYYLKVASIRLEALQKKGVVFWNAVNLLHIGNYINQIIYHLKELSTDSYFFLLIEETRHQLEAFRQALLKYKPPILLLGIIKKINETLLWISNQPTLLLENQVGTQSQASVPEVWDSNESLPFIVRVLYFLPEHIKAIQERVELSEEVIQSTHETAKHIILDIKQFLAKSMVGQIFSAPFIIILGRQLKDKVDMLLRACSSLILDMLLSINTEVFAQILIAMDKLEEALGLELEPRDLIEKILQRYYEGILELLDVRSDIHVGLILNPLPSFQRFEAVKIRIQAAESNLEELITKRDALNSFMSKLDRNESTINKKKQVRESVACFNGQIATQKLALEAMERKKSYLEMRLEQDNQLNDGRKFIENHIKKYVNKMLDRHFMIYTKWYRKHCQDPQLMINYFNKEKHKIANNIYNDLLGCTNEWLGLKDKWVSLVHVSVSSILVKIITDFEQSQGREYCPPTPISAAKLCELAKYGQLGEIKNSFFDNTKINELVSWHCWGHAETFFGRYSPIMLAIAYRRVHEVKYLWEKADSQQKGGRGGDLTLSDCAEKRWWFDLDLSGTDKEIINYLRNQNRADKKREKISNVIQTFFGRTQYTVPGTSITEQFQKIAALDNTPQP